MVVGHSGHEQTLTLVDRRLWASHEHSALLAGGRRIEHVYAGFRGRVQALDPILIKAICWQINAPLDDPGLSSERLFHVHATECPANYRAPATVPTAALLI